MSPPGDMLSGVPGSDAKADLQRYLQIAREALLWKLDGLSEYDVRRPMVPTGTNLFGLVKHVASVEAGYFGDTFGRPFDEPLPWLDEDAEPNADMWATADESREQIIGLYHRVWAHSDTTIETSGARRGRPCAVVARRTQRGDPAHDPGPHDRRDQPARRTRRHRPRAHRRRPPGCAPTTTTWRRATRRGGRAIGIGSSASRRSRPRNL